MQWMALFAQAAPPQPAYRPGEIILTGLWLVGAILAAALLLAWLRRLMRTPARLPTAPSDQLAQFRKLYERGEMTEEEFRRIHATLSARIQEQLLGKAVRPTEVPSGEIGVEGQPAPSLSAGDGKAAGTREQTGPTDGNANGQGQLPSG